MAAVIRLLSLLVVLASDALAGSYQQQHYRQQQQQSAAAYQRKAHRSRQIGMQSQIVSRLFGDASTYDPDSRPPVRDQAEHSAIVVITSIYISRIMWRKNIAEVDLYLRQQWEDSRLTYEVDPREGVHEMTLPRGRRVWRPDTFFIGAQEDAASAIERQRQRVIVEPSGYVRSSERRTVTIGVENVGAFPLSDRRSFTLKLSSFNYPIDDVVYLWANSPPHVLPVEVSEELLDEDRTELSFEDASAGDCIGNYSAVLFSDSQYQFRLAENSDPLQRIYLIGSYSCISVAVTFTGHSSSVMFTLLLPCILLVVVSWLHFWIHGSWSVPRTFSAAVPFFIFVAVIFFLPSPSKAVSVWLVFCVVITFFSLVEYFLVICCGMHRRVQLASGTLPTLANGGATTVQTTNTFGHADPHYFDDEHHGDYPPNGAKERAGGYSLYRQPPQHADAGRSGSEPLTKVTTTTTTVEPGRNYDLHRTVATNVHMNNRIDVISRILFPVVFLVFLIVFIIFYSL